VPAERYAPPTTPDRALPRDRPEEHHRGNDVLDRLEDAMTEGLQRSSENSDAWQRGDGRPVVVVGVDGSPAAAGAALAASSTARALGGAVVAVHVPTLSPWQALAGCLGAGHVLLETAELTSRQIEAELATLFELEDVPWRFVVVHGAVDASLSRVAAELHAAVLVVGAPRRTLRARLAHVLVPNVPRRLLHSGTDRLLVA
jgi:nucleotide-binding universal stress UspA family protein